MTRRHDAEAERQVIGAVMLDPEAVPLAVAALPEPEDFGEPRNAEVWRAVLAIDARREPVDALTVRAELIAHGRLQTVGSPYLAELTEIVATTAHVARHVAIVADHARLRALGAAGRDIAARAADPATRADELAEHAAAKVHAAGRSDAGAQAVPLTDVLGAYFARVEALAGRTISGLPWGLAGLDAFTRGMHPAQHVVVAARPSLGKSALGGNVLRRASACGRTLFISCEMPRDELGARQLSSEARVDVTRVLAADLSPDQFRDLVAAAGRLHALPMFIDDRPGRTLASIRAQALAMHRRTPLVLVVVDFLQLVKVPGIDDRRVEVDTVARGLKELAKELQCPVLSLAQLNRGADQRARDVEPRMSDLRESGEIEQSADVVVFIHRDQEMRANGIAKLILAKQRNGPTGDVLVKFNGAFTEFADLPEDEIPRPAAKGPHHRRSNGLRALPPPEDTDGFE